MTSQEMFEFYIFSPGGLVLWPMDCETSRKTISVVNQYIQTQVLEGHVTNGSITVDKTHILTHHDTENQLFFSVCLHKQIAQQITYLDALLNRIQETFVYQFEQILKSGALLLPNMFVKFTPEVIVEEFRGKLTVASPKQEEPVAAVESKEKVEEKRSPSPGGLRPKFGKGRVRNQSPASKPKVEETKLGRIRYTDQKANDADVESTVIRSESTTEQSVKIEKYSLDDMEGVFIQQKQASRIGSLFRSIIGEKTLTAETMQPVLDQFEQHLINKNVAAHIAKNITAAVCQKLEGTKAGSFESVKNVVTSAVREQIERILTPHRSLDIIRDIQTCKARGEPYSMAFVGVNGVGKSTSLAKVAYLFKSHDFKVLIAACDTYRSGAIDQLKVHSERLDIALYERGGSRRDPVPVAREAIKFAKDNEFDVVLIDTAGRMQNDDNLMKQIARLVNEVKPNLTVFVAEALVGNNGSDQIQSFDRFLRQYVGSSGTTHETHGIDGIVLTKFDTIDDKVGAALTMVFETGHPIVFLGVGQQYRDLRKMNPEFVVSTLLSGF